MEQLLGIVIQIVGFGMVIYGIYRLTHDKEGRIL